MIKVDDSSVSHNMDGAEWKVSRPQRDSTDNLKRKTDWTGSVGEYNISLHNLVHNWIINSCIIDFIH